jgi:hypothetical protein
MDGELLSSCFFPVSLSSGQFSHIELEHHHQFLKFSSWEVPEQWLTYKIGVAYQNKDVVYLWLAAPFSARTWRSSGNAATR